MNWAVQMYAIIIYNVFEYGHFFFLYLAVPRFIHLIPAHREVAQPLAQRVPQCFRKLTHVLQHEVEWKGVVFQVCLVERDAVREEKRQEMR